MYNIKIYLKMKYICLIYLISTSNYLFIIINLLVLMISMYIFNLFKLYVLFIYYYYYCYYYISLLLLLDKLSLIIYT